MLYQRPKKSGVYFVTYLLSDEKYIGGSTDIVNRFTHHRHQLRNGIHKCQRLQLLWDIGNENDFEFEIIELCSPGEVRSLEQKYLDEEPEETLLNNNRDWRGGFPKERDDCGRFVSDSSGLSFE